MSQSTTATAVAGVAAAYLISGLALQHAAYILQYGSIFTPLREWLARTACAPQSPRPLRWLCARLRELIGCQLCSITQLALWFCALPATLLAADWGGRQPLGLSPAAGVLAYTVFGLGVLFSTAAVGVICWDLARLVGRGSDALVLYLRARKELAEAELRARERGRAAEPTLLAASSRSDLRILRSAGSAARHFRSRNDGLRSGTDANR